MRKIWPLALGLVLVTTVQAQSMEEILDGVPDDLARLLLEDTGPGEPWFPANMAEAAELADLVALVQVEGADNERVRDTVVRGKAKLDVLIGYKGARRGERIQVNDFGVRGFKCYYPDRVNEGNRYLVFLKKDHEYEPERRNEPPAYRGQYPSCALPVYVSDDSQYVVRYPIDGFDLPEAVQVREFTFRDPAARIYVDEITLEQERRYRDELGAVRRGMRLEFSRGALLYELRPHIFPDGLPASDRGR